MNEISKKIFLGLETENAAALITSKVNRRYITNFFLEDGFVIITSQESYLIVDSRYYEESKKNIFDLEIIESDQLSSCLSDILSKHKVKKLFIESQDVSIWQLKKIETFLDKDSIEIISNDKLFNVINDMRLIKSLREQKKIRQAQEITDAAFSHIIKRIKKGMTEKEIALEIEFFMKKNGAEQVAFDLIVVSGENTSLPHGKPGLKKISSGDFLTMDIGAVLDGYHSDMTRTIAIGKVSSEQKLVYDTVLKAQKAALDTVKEGESTVNVDKAARNIIGDSGYGDYFSHATGHGVGLEIHEKPSVSCRSKGTLLSGMVITVEPGIYLNSKFGVRIEDMVIVQKNGCENLTKSDKNLIII